MAHRRSYMPEPQQKLNRVALYRENQRLRQQAQERAIADAERAEEQRKLADQRRENAGLKGLFRKAKKILQTPIKLPIRKKPAAPALPSSVEAPPVVRGATFACHFCRKDFARRDLNSLATRLQCPKCGAKMWPDGETGNFRTGATSAEQFKPGRTS